MLRLSKGFTLIELMIVVTIIAFLAAIAIPSYAHYIARVQESAARAEMLKISERLENYRSKQLTYAGYVPDNQNSGAKGVINLPYNETTYDYQITIVDINDSTKSLQDSTVGQGWRIIANPSQTKSSALRGANSLLMDSKGMNCEKKGAVLLVSSTNCN